MKRVDNSNPVRTTIPPTIVERYFNFKQSWKLSEEKTCTYREHIGLHKDIMQDKFPSWLFVKDQKY